MMADLIRPMNKLKQADKVITYRRVLFPAPALLYDQQIISSGTCCGIEKRKFSMNPQKRPRRLPFC